jgi:hypothetical protein
MLQDLFPSLIAFLVALLMSLTAVVAPASSFALVNNSSDFFTNRQIRSAVFHLSAVPLYQTRSERATRSSTTLRHRLG